MVLKAKRDSPDIAVLALMVGFAVMMTLDVALGKFRALVSGLAPRHGSGRR